MASQSGTRYEDRTMQRPGGTGAQTASSGSSHHHMNNSGGGYSVRVSELYIFILGNIKITRNKYHHTCKIINNQF